MKEQISSLIAKVGNMVLNPGVGKKYSGLSKSGQIVSIDVTKILTNPIIDKEVVYEINMWENENMKTTQITKRDLKDLIIKMNLIEKI
jgi:hypothetical protein